MRVVLILLLIGGGIYLMLVGIFGEQFLPAFAKGILGNPNEVLKPGPRVPLPGQLSTGGTTSSSGGQNTFITGGGVVQL